ncbi:hypothetical protein LCGC14_1642560 [marine sediment metagenome]|uniref:Uncharacterized protein n=1 Tax=marine sediment metagenome TaxID=412755 RepID=A0A0F9ILP4_9ZZZZ
MTLLIPEGDTLVTYYMLPFIGLNKNSFGGKFKTSYIDKQGLKVYVELHHNMVSPTYKTNPYYISEMVFKGALIILFTIPAERVVDAYRFVSGKYSEMSREAKKIIFKTSSLPYNQKMGSFTNSHPILQALDKTKTLRTYLIKELQVETLPESVELITVPEEHWFIENRIKQ